ncbi:MIR motif [Pseudocohnilembus persalinus]|uniref:MIR motif n=1 Tax=Pseudocohnilembus persalinus TaxID=266149 RepID=A0A0V0QRF2_PSEPJ|nr:MIR motif [Pseudocohnilembus persalinus]|eukprot:KRX04879.1 MIR motif [Pseudocohnilembus persalinus]
MHNYTVPSKFKHQTRLGNWSEEWELEETKMKDYLKAKEQTVLGTVSRERKLQLSLQKASLTYSKSGIVTFGDHIMLANEKTQGYLACDINERYAGVDEGFAVTTVRNIHPCSRSVFIVERYEKEPDLFQGDQLHYGQKFRIRVNPRLTNKNLYLASDPTTPQRCAKFSRFQLVLMSNRDNVNTVWVAENNNPQIRFEQNGQKVNCNQPVVIKHVLTQQWLGSDSINYSNIFGNEFEVYAHSHQCHNKTQNLIAEKCGRTTVDIPMRNQLNQNTWSFVTASDPSYEFDENVLDQQETTQGLINKIRHNLIQIGEYGFIGLVKAFQNMDRDKNGNLDADDFKWGLRNYGFQFNQHEQSLLLDAFDINKDGSISLGEFLQTLKGESSNQRLPLIQKVYDHIAQKCGGEIRYIDFVKLFNAKRHPDVLKTFRTEREVFDSFVKNFGKRDPDHIVSEEEFVNFYLDVSNSLDRDDIFEAVISNPWGYQRH